MIAALWKKYDNQTLETPCEVVFIDNKNQVCQGIVEKLPAKDIAVVAFRILLPVNKPVVEEKKFVCYWNWEKGKFWPFNAKAPPNPKLPHYFRVEIPYSNPKDIRYFIHSEVIV